MRTLAIKLLLREPLFHFTLIAALLFASFALFRSGSGKTIEISQREIDARIFLAEMASGEALAPNQIDTITQAYIEEQILVIEARIRGLDNDTRIHDILAQKLRHVLSGNIIQPSSFELERFYTDHSARYLIPATVTVDELVFNSRDALPDESVAALNSGWESAEILKIEAGSAAPLPRVSETDLSNIFNASYAKDVLNSDVGAWTGAYLSNRGQHWLKVLELSQERLPDLTEITDLVRLDWIAFEEDLRLDEEVQALLKQYSIVLLNDSE